MSDYYFVSHSKNELVGSLEVFSQLFSDIESRSYSVNYKTNNSNKSRNWGQDSFCDTIKTLPEPLAIVASKNENKNDIIGFVLLSIVRPEAEILRIAVLPEHQKRRIGTKLIEEVKVKIKELGINDIFLEVASDNISAINLYRSSGFSQLAIRKNYYETNVDAIYMKSSN